jgi:hypothetical protein
MRGDLSVSDESWILPDAEGIVWKAARADDLTVVVAPSKTRHLGASIDAVRSGSGRGVPEMYVSVVRASSGGQKIQLPWTPAQCLDGCAVVGLLKLGRP